LLARQMACALFAAPNFPDEVADAHGCIVKQA